MRDVSPTPSASSSVHGCDFMEVRPPQAAALIRQEPASFRPASPAPSSVPYLRREYYGGRGKMLGEEEVQVGLVSGHPLWGHILYPAAIAMARFLEIHSDTMLRSSDPNGKGKNVLELGAGGGLPGLVAALEGAGQVVITDFPDPSLVRNLEENVKLSVDGVQGAAKTTALGYTWGAPMTDLFAAINPDGGNEKFDLILLSDLVFNHSQHAALLDSCLLALSPPLASPAVPSLASLDLDEDAEVPQIPQVDHSVASFSTPAVLCFYSHHRPTDELIAADLGIITMAKAKGWTAKRVWKDQGAGPAFPEDGGSICIRSTVHGWAFTREPETVV